MLKQIKDHGKQTKRNLCESVLSCKSTSRFEGGGGHIRNVENERVWVTFKYERLPTVCNLCGRIGHDNRHCTQATKGQGAEYQYGEWLKANGNYSGTQHKVKTKKDDSAVSNGGCEETRSQPSMVVIGNTVTDSGGGGCITPSRRLRQGYPLSSYLFLLCTEAFSTLIVDANKNQGLSGISICRGSPRITHLFFMDDSLLFCKAERQESQTLVENLERYEMALG